MHKKESIFDLSMRGGLPDMLRAVAKQIEDGEASARSFTANVERERFSLHVEIDLGGSHDA